MNLTLNGIIYKYVYPMVIIWVFYLNSSASWDILLTDKISCQSCNQKHCAVFSDQRMSLGWYSATTMQNRCSIYKLNRVDSRAYFLNVSLNPLSFMRSFSNTTLRKSTWTDTSKNSIALSSLSSSNRSKKQINKKLTNNHPRKQISQL